MGDIELKITLRDWISVLGIGVVFAGFLSLLAYRILGLPIISGAFFGIMLGFSITLFSLVCITGMNRFLLPKVAKRWWNTIAAIFSFIAGFLGTLSTHIFVHITSLPTLDFFLYHSYQSASIIGILTYLIGALIYRFVKARNEKEHIDHLFIESRVRSLETQLNPHFLFNALNSLAELIHQDPVKAELSLLKVSSFLRNTMKEAPLITLEEEIQNVFDYIELENIRFNNAIKIILESDESISEIRIPKFSIQLLAENAIKHSFDSTQTPFTLSIRIHHFNPLEIRVSNTGKAIHNRKFGIGLSNLQERLHYLCDSTVSIEYTNPPTYLIQLKECHEFSHR